MNPFHQKIGAFYHIDACFFNLWAPLKKKVEVIFEGREPQIFEMISDDFGYWSIALQNILSGSRYQFRLNGEIIRPDPASISQVDGVHAASQIIDRDVSWGDSAWKGLPLAELVIYELHIGTFSQEGTFAAAISKLPYLVELGINAIELMPVAQFPGTRNWGYDGVYAFATQESYGGIDGFKRLVNEAHKAGMAIILDVVYNHLGPEGNYLNDFAPYFSEKYKTPWGNPLNFDEAYCDGVRNYYIQNALFWLDECHVDGLRLDAVHAIFDFSANHFLKILSDEVENLCVSTGNIKILVAEFDLNNPQYINSKEKGGYQLAGQWVDEFHHALHCVLTNEKDGYYEDFGTLSHLEKAFRDTYVYDGVYSQHRKKLFGARANENSYAQFVVFSQNHDQIGNRALGDRLSNLLNFEQMKLAAAAVLLSPYVPLLFMGEEYGEQNPFLFFTSHSDELGKKVNEGRKKEFLYFNLKDQFSEPQALETFQKSKLSWNINTARAALLLKYYKYLIQFRKSHPAMQSKERTSVFVQPVQNGNILAFERMNENDKVIMIFNFGLTNEPYFNHSTQPFRRIFDSSDPNWLETQTPIATLLLESQSMQIKAQSFVILEKKMA
ncbi:MAG: malto-oligosyltrehalose trehalohydrolase [Cytophagales bacterium]